ncbi:MAG: hypothetical protein HN919_14370, partial [Verrucomicrobia bacterium]|nr:hypothetical protein [Verrucomicrobiota bacterium]
MKDLMLADNIAGAKAVKDELDKMQFILADLETRLVPTTGDIKPADTEDHSVTGTPAPPEDPEVIGAVGDTVAEIQDVGHALQVWRVLPPHVKSERYRLSVQHAVPGAVGAFRLVAWTDKNGDGVPDRRISRSKELRAEEAGDWSSWDF